MVSQHTYMPMGDLLSLMTSTLGALRHLEVSLPLLYPLGISGLGIVPNMELIRKEIDNRLNEQKWQRSILVDNPTCESKQSTSSSITLNKRTVKAQQKQASKSKKLVLTTNLNKSCSQDF